MQYEVIFTDSFNADIESIANYIADTLCNKNAALDLVTATKEKIALAAEYPEMCPLCTDERLARKKYRKLLVKNYVVLYSVNHEAKEINVMRMFYAKRDYAALV